MPGLVQGPHGMVEVEYDKDNDLYQLTVANGDGDRQAIDLNGPEAEDIAMALAPVAYYEVRGDEMCRAIDRATNAMLYLIREHGIPKEQLLKIVDTAWEWDR